MAVLTKPCSSCRRTLIGRARTDGSGRVIEEWPTCVCEQGAPPVKLQADELTYEERVAAARKTGICMDCDAPVEGQRGKALRCAEHKRRARLDSDNAARRTKAGAAKRRKYERNHRRVKTVRERRNARKRQLHAERMANDPVYRESYRRRRQREASIKHPGYAKRIEYFRRTNADPVRAESKREHARRRYSEIHPERPNPVCATCGEPIDWTPGRGRPPKYCQTAECNPYIRRSTLNRESVSR